MLTEHSIVPYAFSTAFMGRNPEQQPEGVYHHSLFESLEPEQLPEVVIENCIVTSRPIYRKQGQQHVWECSVHAVPDLLHQEQDDYYELHAQEHADMAQSKHLRPGDVVSLTGVVWTQEITLQSGETKLINHVTVSAITVLSRAKRTSITVFEQQNRPGY